MLTNECVGCGTVAHLFCHSERQRGIQCVDASLRYASFSMTGRCYAKHFCHGECTFIHSERSEESTHGYFIARDVCDSRQGEVLMWLQCALFSMTRICQTPWHNRFSSYPFSPIRMCKKSGTPERTRTSNRQSRNLVLYPIELPVQVLRQTYNKSMICA